MIGYAIAKGWKVDEVIKEVGTGLNDERPKLTRLLESEEKIERIIVEHKDRLTRFDFNYLEILSKKMDFEIIVVNKVKDDKEDFISVITSFCERIYSRRKVVRKTEQIIKELTDEINRKASDTQET